MYHVRIRRSAATALLLSAFASLGMLSCARDEKGNATAESSDATVSFESSRSGAVAGSARPEEMLNRQSRPGKAGAQMSAGTAAGGMASVASLSVSMDQAPPSASPSTGADAEPATPAMIIRTGNARFEVDSLEPAIAAVRALAQRLGGYVANSTVMTGRNEPREATLEIKVPAQRWNDLTNGLAPIGKRESLTENSQDVSEEFTDMSARMANARRLESRLVDLLTRQTGKLQEMLMVERELARVREEIERYEGRVRYLRTRSAVSTLTVTVHEPVPVVGSQTPGRSPIAEAFRQAWRNLVGFIAGMIAMSGIIVPLAVLALIGWLVWRRVLAARRDDSTPPRSS